MDSTILFILFCICCAIIGVGLLCILAFYIAYAIVMTIIAAMVIFIFLYSIHLFQSIDPNNDDNKDKIECSDPPCPEKTPKQRE
jgi:hypothetical protein